MKRLKHMRADKRWQEARAILKVHKQERYALFSQLRQDYGFSEYALHAYATKATTAWIADHLDWHDPVIKHGLSHPIKYVRLLRRRASSPQAQGADGEGYRYSAQLAVEGVPYQKPNHQVGTAALGLDLGPSTLAMVPEQGEARLLSFCEELKTDQQKKRRLQRQLERQRRANNPQNYDAKGRVKKGKLRWHDSQGYKKTRRRLGNHERT
jgi:hypothetical protein